MKTNILITCFIGWLVFIACNNEEQPNYTVGGIKPAEDFLDTRDQKIYKCIEIGDQIWFAENLAYYIPGGIRSGCATFKESYFDIEDVIVRDRIFADSLKKAFDNQEIDESYCQKLLENDLTAMLEGWGMQPGTPDWEISWTMMYEMMEKDYIPSAWYSEYYTKEGENITKQGIMEELNDSKKHFQSIIPQVNTLETELQQQEAIPYAKDHMEITEKANNYYSKTYGLLYSLKGALQAVPTEGGWRLPTDEDWKKLEQHLGMSQSEINKENEWRGNVQGEMLKQGEHGIGFNALLGGGKLYVPTYSKNTDNDTYTKLGQNAYFWSSESIAADSTTMGVIRSVAVFSEQILRTTTIIENEDKHPVLFSVRLVKDKK